MFEIHPGVLLKLQALEVRVDETCHYPEICNIIRTNACSNIGDEDQPVFTELTFTGPKI
ncbi:MAG: hypothetical protein H8D67_14860 [Deltaproteobacteria bacterium]|nr:hypothetical protein [Deltaproteobacteria bacterium]